MSAHANSFINEVQNKGLYSETAQVVCLSVHATGLNNLVKELGKEEFEIRLTQFNLKFETLIQEFSGISPLLDLEGLSAIWGPMCDVNELETRAVKAALLLKKELHSLGAFSIGIDAGVAEVGNFGFSQQYSFEAKGRPRDTALQLASEICPELSFAILITDNVFQKIGNLQPMFSPVAKHSAQNGTNGPLYGIKA